MASRLVALTCGLLSLAAARPHIQGDCTEHDLGLSWLASKLSQDAVISCRGQPLQLYDAGRYWGEQYGKNASVVVFPANTQDVSYTVQATAKTELGLGYAFVSGGHSMTNSSSSYDFMIDLSYLNHTSVVDNFEVGGEKITAIKYGGGTTTIQFQAALNGTGWTGIAARVGSVGLGGFSTGGGVGYIAGAYGYATDRLVAAEVVLPSGKIVFATDDNQYSDLLWAFRGAGLGQYGIITTFYQRAAPEPKIAKVGFYIVANDSIPQSYQNTVDFFDNHKDPFSLTYYALGFLPLDFSNPAPKPSDFSLLNIMATVWFDDPTSTGATQKSYDETFSSLLSNVTFLGSLQYNVTYADLSVLGQEFFPYGFRRGFWGPQTTKISTKFMSDVQVEFNKYINAVLANGDFPAASTYVLQYMSPGLNGNLPKSDAATAWPHSVAGHQTLFNPGWSLAQSDGIADNTNDILNRLTYDHQAAVSGKSYSGASDVCGGLDLCDYPNYIGRNVPGRHVWGKNILRLIALKQKYDPLCTLHTGRVFASPACIAKGVANVFP